MQTSAGDTMIDQRVIEAINALGQLGIGALVIVCVIFAIAAWIIYLRVGSKGKESDTRRDEETNKIMMSFAGMVERADANREKAVDVRNSETAKAILATADVLRTVTETQRAATAAIEQGTLYRKEQVEATMQQTDQLKAMRIDFKEWPAATKTALEVLINTVGDLNRSVGLLVTNADNGISDRQEMRTQLATIKEIAETILQIAQSNAVLMTSLADRPGNGTSPARDLLREAKTALPQPTKDELNPKV